MRILIDIVHPAHVHFYRYMIAELHRRGHRTVVVAREKDVTVQLLQAFGIPHRVVGRAGTKSRHRQFGELLQRVHTLFRIAKARRSDIVLTRNPAGTIAARLARVPSIFDTDDGTAAGAHFSLAKLFATVITTPESLNESHGPKQRNYKGYKATAYLHPRHFRPDATVLDQLGVPESQRFFLLRLVAMQASHDIGESGLQRETVIEIARRLQAHGRLFVTSESAVIPELAEYRCSIPPERMHDALAFADLLVGDSQTMSAEATLLGTPSIRISSFTGRLECLEHLQREYEGSLAFRPTEATAILAALDSFLGREAPRRGRLDTHRSRLEDSGSVTDWYLDLVEEVGHRNRYSND